MSDQVFMDLGDFVPESYDWGFTFCGRRYRFQYEEITVDEMLRLMEKKPGEDWIALTRRSVGDFLRSVCVEGDKDQLVKDLAVMPFRRRGSLCIERLYEKVSERIKKNDPGAGTTTAAP